MCVLGPNMLRGALWRQHCSVFAAVLTVLLGDHMKNFVKYSVCRVLGFTNCLLFMYDCVYRAHAGPLNCRTCSGNEGPLDCSLFPDHIGEVPGQTHHTHVG
jgi:hypothetical protein